MSVVSNRSAPAFRQAVISSLGLWLTGLAVSGCAGSPWTREVSFVSAGVVLYKERKFEDGTQVPLGYAQPVKLPTEKLLDLFRSLVFEQHSLLHSPKDASLFTEEEATRLAEPMSAAIASIGPDERLRFLVTRSNWSAVVFGMDATSGVIFSTAPGTLQLAFDHIQERISGGDGGDPALVVFRLDPTEMEDVYPILAPTGTKVHVAQDGRVFPRWLEVDLARVVSRPAPKAADSAGGVSSAPGATPGPATQSPTGVDSAPGPSPAAEGAYAKLRDRLQWLKRLRSDGALTEEEYTKEYEATLKELRATELPSVPKSEAKPRPLSPAP
jgi:hypothetical protein